MKRPLVRSKSHRLSQFLYSLSLVFLGIGLFSLGWAVWPPPMDVVQFNIPPGPLPGAPGDGGFSSLSDYSLEISWQRWVRRGESGVLQLRLTDMDPLPQAERDASQVLLAEPALYPLRVEPPGEVQANLGDDQTMLLTWAVNGDERGTYGGKLYVSFGFFDDAEDALIAIPVAVLDLDIQVIELWGLAPGLVIWFGLVSLVLWGGMFVLGRVVAGRSR
jgi:hypothetical protein